MDKIYVNKMVFYGYHGVYGEERTLGQRFYVDVALELDLKPAGRSDDLKQTVNYAEVYDIVKQIVEGPPYRLIESVAESIAQALLKRFITVASCRVKVTKPDPPIPGHYDSVAVDIVRSRADV